jgi:hypothetical protein
MESFEELDKFLRRADIFNKKNYYLVIGLCLSRILIPATLLYFD